MDSNVDSLQGNNHLLRSVDGRSNHVLFEKRISPNQIGGLNGTKTSYIEEISGYQQGHYLPVPCEYLRCQRGLDKLYVAVLAYDPALHRMCFHNVPAPVQPTGYDCHGSVREEDAAY